MNFDFLTACHKIKSDKVYSTSILVILHFSSKLLLLFCSNMVAFSGSCWWQFSMVAFGDIT